VTLRVKSTIRIPIGFTVQEEERSQEEILLHWWKLMEERVIVEATEGVEVLTYMVGGLVPCFLL
jgi:hypothetical protein